MTRIVRWTLLALLSGCLQAESVKACGEACKDRGGVYFVDGCSCQCKGLH